MASLTENILTVQKELKAPKNNYNSFGKYHYRSAEDILEAVKPLNTKQGLLLTITDEAIQVGERHYIKAEATITNGEDSMSVSAYARESENKKGMDESQITGTASSYARKYALNGLYLIDDTKDADTDEYKNQSKQSTQQTQPITQQQVGDIKTKAMQFAKMRSQDVEKVYEALKVSDVTNLSKQDAEQCINKLDAWIIKAGGEQ